MNVTSATKMAALFLSSEEMKSVSNLTGLVDDKLIDILSLYHVGNNEKIEKKIGSSFTKEAFLESCLMIFDVAVAKEKEKNALMTTQEDTITFGTDDRTSIVPRDVYEWRLVNRGAKPKIAGEILLLSLFADDSDKDFPVDTLEKCSTKGKPNKKQVETSSDLANAEASTTPEASDDERDRTGKDSPNDLQRRVERFIIREEDPVTSYRGTTIPVTVVVELL